MKKLLFLVVICLVLAGCAKKEEPKPVEPTEKPAEKPVETVGGWQKAEDGTITEELQAIFEDATSKLLGVNYEPVELLETQIVAGTNYRFLAKATAVAPEAETKDVEVVIYQDISGNCSVTDVIELEPSEAEPLMGGWEKVEDGALNDDLMAIWNNANENGFQNDPDTTRVLDIYEPVELLETQVVAGRNYRFLAKDLSSNAEPAPLVEVVIYQNLEGKAVVLDILEHIEETVVS